MSVTPQQMQALLKLGQPLANSMGSPQTTQGLGDANLGLGIYSGLSSGTPTGDVGALASGAKLYGNLAGNSMATGAGNALGGALGIYGGIKEGGVAGDTQAALGAAQLGAMAANAAGATGAATALGAAGPIGMALAPAILGMTMPTVSRTQSGWDRLISGLQSPHGKDATAQQNAAYFGSLDEAGTDPQGRQVLQAMGIQAPVDQPLATQMLQAIPVNDRGPYVRPVQHAAGGKVTSHLDRLLGAAPMSSQPRFDDGGSVDYFTPDYGNDISGIYSSPSPDLNQFVLPSDSQQSLQQALYNNGANDANPIGGLNTAAYDQMPNIQGLTGNSFGGSLGSKGALSGLGNLLSNPNLLGALLGGGIGLAGALGSNNGQQTMLANYKPSPPQMFQGSGPSSSNMYGNFSAQPRQRLNPTNINYATAGQNPTPGGNMFYTPSGGGPTAASSQQSPLQQYGAPAPQQQQTMQPNQMNVQQLLAALQQGGGGGQATTGGNVISPAAWLNMHPVFMQAKGGEIHGEGAPSMGPLSQHMTPASKGGPSYIQGPGDGTSDDIDARLSNGEYVMDAGSVAMLGNGSNEAGAKKLDELRMNLRKHAAKDLVQGKQFMKSKKPQSYIGGKS